MTDAPTDVSDRLADLELQVRNLGRLVNALARHGGDDASVTETKLNGHGPADPHEGELATLGRLAPGVAHDANNLLNVMVGTCELLAESFDAGDARRETAAGIAALGHEAGEMLHLLAGGPAPAGRVTLAELFAALGKLLPRVVGPDRGVKVECRMGPEAIPLSRLAAERLVLNLVGNARAATPAGGIIRVAAEAVAVADLRGGTPDAVPPGAYAALSVADDGAGIAEADLRRMFRRRPGPRGGRGIGLGVVRGLVADAGGFIQVETAPGRGTLVRVYLPVG